MGLEWDPEGDAERRKESRGRLYLAIAVTIAILGFGISKLAQRSREKEVEENGRRLAELSQRHYELPAPAPSPVNMTNGGDPVDALHPPHATNDELVATTTEVCKHLLACGAASDGGSAEVAKLLPDCIRAQDSTATDAFSRDLLTMANRAVLDACSHLTCDRFPTCYLDTLQHLSGAPAAKPIDPATKKQLIALVCKVAAANAGKVPDLNAPDASPDVIELKRQIAALNDVSAIADLMKEAIATCGQ